MKQADLVKTLALHEARLQRLEAAVGQAGVLPPYQSPELPELEKPPEPEVRNVKKKAEPFTLDVTKLDAMSHTELVQVCRTLGFEHASRQLLREDLVGLILGEVEGEVIDPLSGVREKTHAFIEGNRSLMASLMRCDLNCPTCPHDIVVECYAVNHQKVEE